VQHDTEYKNSVLLALSQIAGFILQRPAVVIDVTARIKLDFCSPDGQKYNMIYVRQRTLAMKFPECLPSSPPGIGIRARRSPRNSRVPGHLHTCEA
jgi:hypothetical protein